MKKETQAAADDWNPPKVTVDGIHLAGASDLPANHRLRAEALVALGKKSDQDGIIGDELIADTAERLAAEAAAAAPAKPLAEQNAKELRATAKAESIAIPPKSTNAAIVGLIQADRDAKAAAQVPAPSSAEGTDQ
jgi:hypothetical protein